jgi:hypothetical protein
MSIPSLTFLTGRKIGEGGNFKRLSAKKEETRNEK